MRRRSSLLPVMLLLVACGDPTLAEIAEQEITLSVSGVTSAPETAAVGESQGGLGLERAVVRAAHITLSACRENTADLVLGARAYDLLGEPRPAETVLTAMGELCRLRFDVKATAKDGADGVPQGASLYVTGTDSTGEAVEWSSQEAFSLVFEAEEDRTFGHEPLLLGFDLAIWLESLPEADGDETQARLRRAAALYVDVNGDGSLDDDDEQTPIARASSDE